MKAMNKTGMLPLLSSYSQNHNAWGTGQAGNPAPRVGPAAYSRLELDGASPCYFVPIGGPPVAPVSSSRDLTAEKSWAPAFGYV